MLRQRKTTPVKEALNTRGGDENAPAAAEDSVETSKLINTRPTTPEPSEAKRVTKDKDEQEKKDEPKVSKFRAAVFPVYGAEVNKFLLMGAIKFFVIMALTLTRDTKDTLVVTQCGAEAIAFLKVSL